MTPPAGAEAGARELTGTTAYTARDVSRTITDRASTTLAFGQLADAFNDVGVTTSAAPAPGDLDGGGSSFLAERLAEMGVTPGATVAANGFSFTWPDAQPGTKDNVASGGETIRLEGKGNALAILGTGTSGSASGAATVHYADGTVTTGVLGLPNWCCPATDSFRSKIAVVTKDKNTSRDPTIRRPSIGSTPRRCASTPPRTSSP